MLATQRSIWTKLTFLLILLSFCFLASCDNNLLVLAQDEISQETLDTLRNDDIITTDEQVYYLYTDSTASGNSATDLPLSNMAKSLLGGETHEIGILFTEKRVVSFSRNQSNQILTVTDAAYENIKDISYDSFQFGPNKSMFAITVVVRDGENLSFTLPDQKERSKEFLQLLQSTWQANPKIEKLNVMVAAGEIPGHHHQYDHTLSQVVKQKLLEANILQAHETIALFFTPAPEAFLTQGYMFSDERIVVYKTSAETGDLEIQSAQFSEVSDIVTQSKYEKNADGSYRLLPDTHLQVFVDGAYSFGFDDYDDSVSRMVAYHAFRLWDQASPVLKKTEKNKSEGLIPPNKTVNGEHLSKPVVQGLIKAQLLQPAEIIYYFATPHPKSYTQFGTLATNMKITQYGVRADMDGRYLKTLDYKDISHIQIEKNTTDGDSKIHIFAGGEHQFSLEIPVENGADDTIYSQIVMQWETLKKDG